MYRVSDIMTARLHTIHREKLVCDVTGMMDREQISALPLVDDGEQVVGIVTQGDILHLDFVGGDPFEAQAWEVSRSPVVKVTADTRLDVAAKTMVEKGTKHLIVTDRVGRAIGMVSSFDFVSLMANRAGAPKPASRLRQSA